jgi:hypothetical protein
MQHNLAPEVQILVVISVSTKRRRGQWGQRHALQGHASPLAIMQVRPTKHASSSSAAQPDEMTSLVSIIHDGRRNCSRLINLGGGQ